MWIHTELRMSAGLRSVGEKEVDIQGISLNITVNSY